MIKLSIISVLLGLVSCSSFKKQDYKDIKVDGKRFSFYMEGTDARSPASGSVLVHPLKDLILRIGVNSRKAADNAVLEHVNKSLGKSYKSLDEVQKQEEAVLTNLYLKVFDNPKVLTGVNFTEALKNQAVTEGFADYVAKAVNTSAEKASRAQLPYLLDGRSRLQKNLLGAAIDGVEDSKEFLKTIGQLKSLYKNATGTKKHQLEAVYNMALLNAAAVGKTVPGSKCNLVTDKLDVISEMQKFLGEVINKEGRSIASLDIYIKLAELTYLKGVDPDSLVDQAKISHKNLSSKGDPQAACHKAIGF